MTHPAKIIFTCLMLLSPAVGAQTLQPPAQIKLGEQSYALAYQQTAPDGRALYEYTSGGEPIEHWRRLVTINYYKGVQASAERWRAAMEQTLATRTPKPSYRSHSTGSNGYLRFVLGPRAGIPHYEANVAKSFHLADCGGLVIFQYAAKYPSTGEPSASEKQALLQTIDTEGQAIVQELETSDWAPVCR